GFTPVVHGDAVFFRKSVQPAAAAPPSCAPARAARPAPARAPLRAAGPTRMRAGQGIRPAPAALQAHVPQPCDELMARVRTLVNAGARAEALQCLRRAAEADPLSAPLQRSAAL